MENSSYQKILNLAATIKNITIEKLSMHEEKTSSTQQKGHSYAGGAPQEIGQNLSAGTDNGYYARADHVHTVDFANIKNTPNALNVVDDLNTNDGSSPLSAKQGKWLNDNKAASSHTHSYISTAGGSVGTSNLASNAVTTDKITDGAVTNAKIADGTINGATKIATGSITAGRIADGAIITTLLGDGKVTTAKIADSAVTSVKIADGTIVNGDISSSAAIAYSKLSGVAASSHAHGNITNTGTIGSTANLPIITGTSGKLQAGSFGTTANTFCQGNDSRLSDSRVPVFNTVGASESTEKDLNTFKTGGFYYISSDAQSKYVDNCPLPKAENKSFFLLVETWGSTSTYYVKQTLTYYHTNKTYTRTCNNQTWGTWDELKKTFDFTGMKGTDATVGYVKPLKFTIGKGYQDKPIEIEIYQRNRNEKCTVQIAFNNTNTNDPGITKLTHTGHNINIYLYKEGTGIWSLITSKGHDEKYGEMSVKISNPNTGINITRQDVHLASLPTSNLTTSTYIGFTQDEKDKLAGIATGANKTTIANNLTTTTVGSALDATQGKALADGKAPTSHASTGTGYGVSTTANYGHTKIVQNLTTDDGNGLALGAGQGKALKTLVDGKAASSHTHTKAQITDFPTSMTPTFTIIDASSSAHANLNSYVTGGFYYCNNNKVAPYIDNQPLTTGMKGFFLLVETWGELVNYAKQTLTYYHDNKTYTRTKADGTWGTWTELSKDTTYSASTVVGNADTSAGAVGTSASYARADHVHKQSSLYATASHNHSTWTEKQSYSSGNKTIHLYVNEQLQMCDLYWQNVTALNANTNHSVAASGWINATYRPHQPVVGGGSYTGTTTVGTGGDIVYRIPVTISSNTVYGHAMWHY